MPGWTLSFPSRIDLEKIVRAISDINPHITIHVVQNDDGFSGILVEDMHVSHSSLIRARLACEVSAVKHDQKKPQVAVFTCDCKHLGQVLKSTKAQYRLDIHGQDGSDEIVVESLDTMQSNYRSRTTLKTLQINIQEFTALKKMEFTYALRIDAPFVKSFLKNNSEMGAEDMRIKLMGSDDASQKMTLVQLQCTSSMSSDVKEFLSEDVHVASLEEEGEGDSMDLQPGDEPPSSEWEAKFTKELFSGSYSIDSILKFVKSVDARPVLLFKLSQSTPLLIESPLCSPNSSVFLLVSERVSDDG